MASTVACKGFDVPISRYNLGALLLSMSTAIGVGLLLFSSSGFENAAEATGVPARAPEPVRQTRSTLPGRLDALREEIDVRQDQEPAWRRFAEAMTGLDALTRTYERQVAAGDFVDAAKERGRHALIYGAAMNDMNDNLSPGQALAFNRLARDLVRSAVCRRLAKAS